MTEHTLASFQQWLMEEGKAVATIESYLNDVRKFTGYLREKDCDPEVLLSRFYFTSYMKHLEAEGMAISTRNKKVNSLKVYNDWLFKNRLVDDIFFSIKKDKVKIAHGSETEVSVLNDQQVEQFLFYLEKHQTGRHRSIRGCFDGEGKRKAERSATSTGRARAPASLSEGRACQKQTQ